MPLFDYLCLECGRLSEILSSNQTETPRCKTCGGVHLKKMLAAPSSLSGIQTHRLPGRGDSPCCGNTPLQAGCAGPGSCCGKAKH
jgi:putative FmdB family regulatory protein